MLLRCTCLVQFAVGVSGLSSLQYFREMRMRAEYGTTGNFDEGAGAATKLRLGERFS